MSEFVMGLLVVQVLGGLYLLSFLSDAGAAESNARATRLPDPLVAIHPLLAGVAVVLWLVWLNARDLEALPWVTLGTLVAGAAIGGFLDMKTRKWAPDPVEIAPEDPASARLVEKRIPKPAVMGHGALALGLIVCVLLVALGVA